MKRAGKYALGWAIDLVLAYLTFGAIYIVVSIFFITDQIVASAFSLGAAMIGALPWLRYRRRRNVRDAKPELHTS